MTRTHVYKILAADDWDAAKQIGHPETKLDVGDGYVHLSTRAQVGETLALHYKHASGVRLLEYSLDDLEHSGGLKWEASRGGDLFPHLYGTLPLATALRVWVLDTNKDGIPILPGDL